MEKNILKKDIGVTLVELIVSITILALIVAPFFGVFLSGTRNNTQSLDNLNTAAIMQKAMEELKASALSPVNRVEYSNYPGYSSQGSIRIEYSVSPADAAGYTFPAGDIGNLPADAVFTINNGNVSLNGGITNPLAAKEYLMNIRGAGSYSFGEAGTAGKVLNTGTIAESNNSYSIKILVNSWNPSSDPRFNLHMMVDGVTVGKDVFLYVSGNNAALNMTNDGTKPFYEYDNISTDPAIAGGFKTTIYRIQLNAWKLNQVTGQFDIPINNLVSYVKR